MTTITEALEEIKTRILDEDVGENTFLGLILVGRNAAGDGAAWCTFDPLDIDGALLLAQVCANRASDLLNDVSSLENVAKIPYPGHGEPSGDDGL